MAAIRLARCTPRRANLVATANLATARTISTTTSQITHPYFVARTASNGLPVYTDIRNAGSKQVTLIRHISGDADALRKDLLSSLFAPVKAKPSPSPSPSLSSIPRVTIQTKKGRVNTLTRHLEVAGPWRREVVEWLTNKGF